MCLENFSDDIINEKEPDQFRVKIKNLEFHQFQELSTFALSVM